MKHYLFPDTFLARNPWKIHEEFGIMVDDIVKDFQNPLHPRPMHNWQLNRSPSRSFGFTRRTTDPDPAEDQKISIANGVFLNNGYSLRPDYRDAVQNVYKSNIRNLDFLADPQGAARFINE